MKPDMNFLGKKDAVDLMIFFGQIFDLLISIGGAAEQDRDQFLYLHCRCPQPCDEFRFIGHLGYGGKYRRKSNTVDCYPEDVTDERRAIIAKLNEALEKLIA